VKLTGSLSANGFNDCRGISEKMTSLGHRILLFVAILGSVLAARAACAQAPGTAQAAQTAPLQEPPGIDGTVSLGDFTLHYRAVGKGRPLLILSGGPGLEVSYMSPVAQGLGSSYQCILLEQRGTGRSLPAHLTPETINVHLMVEDIEALRASLHQKRLLILGHSWGGMLAMAYAAAHPDRVDSLILVDSGGMDSSFQTAARNNITARASTSERQKIKEAAQAIEQSTDPQAADFAMLELLTPFYFYDRELAAQMIVGLTKEVTHPQTSHILWQDVAQNYRVHGEMVKFSRPVLIIHGRQDPIPESTAIQNKETFQDAQLIFLDECGPLPLVGATQSLLQQRVDFFTDKT